MSLSKISSDDSLEDFIKYKIQKYNKSDKSKLRHKSYTSTCELRSLDEDYEPGSRSDQVQGAPTFTIDVGEKAPVNQIEPDDTTETQKTTGWMDFSDERKKGNDDDLTVVKSPEKGFLSRSPSISQRDCGEPQPTQFLEIDFSPETGVDDDEFVINKCAQFWKFLENHTELLPLKALPEVFEFSGLSEPMLTPSPTISTKSSEDFATDLSPITRVALNWLKEEKVIACSLFTKTEPICLPVSKAYSKYGLDEQKNMPPKKDNHYKSKTCVQTRISCLNVKRNEPAAPPVYRPIDDLGQIMTQMRKFDMQHPTCLDPPGHPPSLIRAQLLHKAHVRASPKGTPSPMDDSCLIQSSL